MCDFCSWQQNLAINHTVQDVFEFQVLQESAFFSVQVSVIFRYLKGDILGKKDMWCERQVKEVWQFTDFNLVLNPNIYIFSHQIFSH